LTSNFFSSLASSFGVSDFASDFDSEVEAEVELEPSGPKSDGISIEDKSSPSSANMAIICPTGTCLDPSPAYALTLADSRKKR